LAPIANFNYEKETIAIANAPGTEKCIFLDFQRKNSDDGMVVNSNGSLHIFPPSNAVDAMQTFPPYMCW